LWNGNEKMSRDRSTWKAMHQVPPTLSQLDMLRRLVTELNLSTPEPKTEAEATFVLDDLLELKRRRKPAAAGR
jgi:hypothetical protein